MTRVPRLALLPLLAAAALLAARPAAAQLTLEARAGFSVGNDEAAASRLEPRPRPAVSLGAEYAATRTLSVYAGVSRAAFGCEEGFCTDRDVSFSSTGADAGLRLHLPHLPWLRAGVLYHTLSTTTRAGPDPGESSSGQGFGYEVGAGVTIPLLRRVRLLPGLGYRTHSAASGDQVSIVSAEMGIAFRM
jgi:hypothetical protein